MFHCNGWCFPWTVALLGGTHVCLRRVEAAAILDAMRDARRRPLLRRADRAQPADRRAGRAARTASTQKVRGMVAGAAPPAAMIEGMARIGFDITHVYGLTEIYGPAAVCGQAAGLGERDLCRADAAQRPPGRALRAARKAMTVLDPATMRRGAGRRRDDGRDHVPRQHRDEGLPEEPEGDRRGVRRRLVPHRRSRRARARPLRQDQGPQQGRHHLRRREHQLARGRGRALSPSRRCSPAPWSPGPTRSGARRRSPSSS